MKKLFLILILVQKCPRKGVLDKMNKIKKENKMLLELVGELTMKLSSTKKKN